MRLEIHVHVHGDIHVHHHEPPKPPCARLGFSVEDLPRAAGVDPMEIVKDEGARFRVRIKTNPVSAKLDLQDQVPQWQVGDPSVASIESVDDDKLGAVIQCGAPGVTKIMVVGADADRDPGEVRELSAEFDLTVKPLEVASIEIEEVPLS